MTKSYPIRKYFIDEYKITILLFGFYKLVYSQALDFFIELALRQLEKKLLAFADSSRPAEILLFSVLK